MTSKQDWREEFRLKFSQIVTRIVNLGVIPNIQSQINERIPPQRGFSVYSEENKLVDFIQQIIDQSVKQTVEDFEEMIGEDEKEDWSYHVAGCGLYEVEDNKDISARNGLRQELRQLLQQKKLLII